MSGVKEYVLTVAAAVLICSIAKQIIGERNASGKIVKVVSGVFLIVTLLTPLTDIQIGEIDAFWEETRSMASDASDHGLDIASSAMGEIIKQKTEAYILDEAKNMGLDVTVEVKLCDSDPPVPCQVIITGSASPYKKTALCRYISNNLGILPESQKWI
jgi:stage III sporulation protein AF